jgi:Raf kinase inhibitor-like YbhB/YbcL family protein
MQTNIMRMSVVVVVVLIAGGTLKAQRVAGSTGTSAQGVAGSTATGAQQGAGAGPRGGGGAAPMALMNTSWADGGIIPAKNAGATGASPALSWTNTPNGTVSFVLLMHDPDVARNKMSEDVLHWLMFNIPADKKDLAEGLPAGTLPDGSIQIKNVSNANAYRGPGAPANGPVHHYTIELFALDTNLGLGADATRDDVMKAMQGHVLGKAVYVGLYKQPAQ